jgi:hypothetical protein
MPREVHRQCHDEQHILRDEKYDARWVMMFENQYVYDGSRGERLAHEAVRPHLCLNAVTSGELYTTGELQFNTDIDYTKGTFYLGGG